jgi:U4/U6.U5 tri-snRNP-associated protein 1
VPEAAEPDENEMSVDTKPVAPVPRDLDVNFVDDDELQAALSRSRQAKLRKVKKVSPEEIARRGWFAHTHRRWLADGILVRERSAVDGDVKMEEDGGDIEEIGGLVIDDTSEFVRSITYDPVAVKAEPTEARLTTPAPAAATGGDVAVSELAAGEVAVKEEEEDEDEGAILNALEAAMEAAEADGDVDMPSAADADVGTAAEQTFGSGMASTLTILRQQGLIAGGSADQAEREQVQRQRDLWLAAQRRRVAERELERVRARGQPKDQAQREYENRVREQQEARETLDAFREYKPDVRIEYHDEFGRTLTPKEAWKALSHKFHGKGSGRMKTEKRLKRIAEEKKQEAMASGDTPLSMQQAFQRRQEQAGQAHMVLSVGNRGYASHLCAASMHV